MLTLQYGVGVSSKTTTSLQDMAPWRLRLLPKVNPAAWRVKWASFLPWPVLLLLMLLITATSSHVLSVCPVLCLEVGWAKSLLKCKVTLPARPKVASPSRGCTKALGPRQKLRLLVSDVWRRPAGASCGSCALFICIWFKVTGLNLITSF